MKLLLTERVCFCFSFLQIADKVEAFLMADIAHISGLVATEVRALFCSGW